MNTIEVTWSDTDVAIITLLGEHDLATREDQEVTALTTACR